MFLLFPPLTLSSYLIAVWLLFSLALFFLLNCLRKNQFHPFFQTITIQLKYQDSVDTYSKLQFAVKLVFLLFPFNAF